VYNNLFTVPSLSLHAQSLLIVNGLILIYTAVTSTVSSRTSLSPHVGAWTLVGARSHGVLQRQSHKCSAHTHNPFPLKFSVVWVLHSEESP